MNTKLQEVLAKAKEIKSKRKEAEELKIKKTVEQMKEKLLLNDWLFEQIKEREIANYKRFDLRGSPLELKAMHSAINTYSEFEGIRSVLKTHYCEDPDNRSETIILEISWED